MAAAKSINELLFLLAPPFFQPWQSDQLINCGYVASGLLDLSAALTAERLVRDSAPEHSVGDELHGGAPCVEIVNITIHGLSPCCRLVTLILSFREEDIVYFLVVFSHFPVVKIFDIYYFGQMGRKLINFEQMPGRFPAGTLKRIDAVRRKKENRAAFLRAAVEREIERRSKRQR